MNISTIFFSNFKINSPFHRRTVHCITPKQCIMKSSMPKRMNKIWTKFPAFLVTIIPFTMKCRQLISIAAMCQPSRECMRTLRQDAKRIMCATMDVKDTRVHRSYAQTARFSIKKNSLAIGGTMLIVHRRKISISECRNKKKLRFNSTVTKNNTFPHTCIFFFSLNADPEHNPYFPKKKAEDLHDGSFVINA